MAETRCTCGAGHTTFGECIRSKGIRIGYCGQGGGDASAQKKWDGELQLFRDARSQGVMPAGTKTHQIRQALELSERVGKPFNAANGTFGE